MAGAVIDQFQGQLGEDFPANLTGYLIGYLIVSIAFVALYIWLGVVLWQASDGIRDAHRSWGRSRAGAGPGQVRVFFVVVGIITLSPCPGIILPALIFDLHFDSPPPFWRD